MTPSSIFFDLVVFLLSRLINGQSFIIISLMVLELSQFLFIKDWPEIRKSETIPSECYPIPGEWCKLSYAAKCQVYSFYRFRVIQGKSTGGGVKIPTPRRSSEEKYILKIFAKITGRNLHRSLSLIKLQAADM